MRTMLGVLGTVLCLMVGSMWNGSVRADELTIYTEEYAPWNFTKDGEVTGMATEIVRGIMKRTGKEYPIQSVPWARGYQALQDGPNTVLFCTVRSEAREKLGFQWVGPLGMLRSVLIQRKGAGHKIESLEDAKTVGSIGVYAEDIFEQTLIGAGFENLERVNNPVLTMRMLIAGRVDLVMIDEGAALIIAQEEGIALDEYEVAFVYEEMPMCIAFSKDVDPAIVAAWDKAFQAMVEDGTVKAITQKYFGASGETSHAPVWEEHASADPVVGPDTPAPQEASLPPADPDAEGV